MVEQEGSRGAAVDLAALQRAVSVIGWGCVIGWVTIGPLVVSPAGRIGLPSALRPLIVLFGLGQLPLGGAPIDLVTRRRLVVIAVAVAGACDLASVLLPDAGPVVGAAGVVASALGAVLFLALMVGVMRWLGAVGPRHAWQRLTRFVLAFVGLCLPLWLVATVVVPALPGASVATPNAGGVVVGATHVTGMALDVAIVLALLDLAVSLAGAVLAFQAFRATKRWITSHRPASVRVATLEAELRSSDEPPAPPAGRDRSPTRVVDGRTILRVDRTPT